MDPLVVRHSPKKLLLIAAPFLAGLVFFTWLAVSGEVPRRLAWLMGLGILACLIVVLTAGYFAWKPRTRFVIDDAGVYVKGFGVIPWRDIEGAYVRRVTGQQLLCLRVGNEDAYLQALEGFGKAAAEMNRKAGLTPFSFAISGGDCPPERVIEVVAQRTTVERTQ